MDDRIPYLLGATQAIFSTKKQPIQLIEMATKICATTVIATLATKTAKIYVDHQLNIREKNNSSQNTIPFSSFIEPVIEGLFKFALYKTGYLLGSKFLSLSNGNPAWAIVHTFAICGIFQAQYICFYRGLAHSKNL